MIEDKRRIITSNPKANEIIANMSEEEYEEWSEPYKNTFDEEFPKPPSDEVLVEELNEHD